MYKHCIPTKHGATSGKASLKEKKIYQTWRDMLARCCMPGASRFSDYGERGITVCKRWRKFTVFYSDMGQSWFIGATIDRIKVDRGYSPDNCQWLTKSEQNLNRRDTVYVQDGGEKMTLQAAAKKYAAMLGISQKLFCRRISEFKWTLAQVIQYYQARQRGSERSVIRHTVKYVVLDGVRRSFCGAARSLSEELGVSERRIYRDFAELGWTVEDVRAYYSSHKYVPRNGVRNLAARLIRGSHE